MIQNHNKTNIDENIDENISLLETNKIEIKQNNFTPTTKTLLDDELINEEINSSSSKKSTFIDKDVKKNLYINQKELLYEVIISKEGGKMTKRLEELIILLGERTIQKMLYYNPQDREDCLQEGLLALYKNWDKFDPQRSTLAFAYYTEIFKRGMAKGFNEIHGKKMKDSNKRFKYLSIESSNDGDGLFGF